MKPLPTIITTPEGFCFEGTAWAPVNWTTVRRISTYKLDLSTIDEIRLVLDYGGAVPMHIEVSEEQPGFEQFRTFVEKYFCFANGWWESVMKPAFARNEAVLYERAEQGHAGDVRNARA
jgi:hypothetical protein